jgi:hypothetical protein
VYRWAMQARCSSEYSACCEHDARPNAKATKALGLRSTAYSPVAEQSARVDRLRQSLLSQYSKILHPVPPSPRGKFCQSYSPFAEASLAGWWIYFATGLSRLPYLWKTRAATSGAFDFCHFAFRSLHKKSFP